MALTKVDISLLEDVGGANNLVKLDSNAKIPAGPATNLLNKPGPFTSTSDPAIDSNKALGTEWLNKTSGEMYICTTATAGANVWTNVGAGSGDVAPFHPAGDNYGFCSGGTDNSYSYNTVDKFSLTSDGNATDHSDLAIINTQSAGNSSSTHGYTQGGESTQSGFTGEYNNVVQKFNFTSTSTGSDVGNLTVTRDKLTGSSSTTHGYAMGGDSGSASNVIDRTSFASDGNSADVGDLSSARKWLAGCSSSTYGYAMGGEPSVNIIDKFAFGASSNSTDVGDLTAGRAGGSGQNSSTHGYCSGGHNPSNVVDKWSFTTDGDATDVGNLTSARNRTAGCSSTSHGYCMGGSTAINIIDKNSFSADGDSSDVGDLTVGRYGLMGHQY